MKTKKPTQKDLLEILTYRRPHLGIGESLTIARFIDGIPGMRADIHGNRILQIGAEPTTMFSAHTDTVHTIDGRQVLHFDKKRGEVSLNRSQLPPKRLKKADKWFRNCLGADDGAGIYVLLRLIHAKKPGLYVFHRGEECGGIGSEAIARDFDLFCTYSIERAIAFDRRGYSDVITHQSMQRCASDIFASALADGLRLNMKPCAHGVFTDTANYMEIVPECTNVSVGYHYEHTDREWQNLTFLETLIENAIALDFDALPTVRNPYEEEPVTDFRKYIDADISTAKLPTYDDWHSSMRDDWPIDDKGRPCYHAECRYLVHCLYMTDRKARVDTPVCEHAECGGLSPCLVDFDR